MLKLRIVVKNWGKKRKKEIKHYKDIDVNNEEQPQVNNSIKQ